MRVDLFAPPSSSYWRTIVYDDNEQVIEWQDNWLDEGEHYKRIDGVWTTIKPYKSRTINPRRRKSNTWDK